MTKIYERIFNSDDDLESMVEMANLRPNKTGLDHRLIYISSKQGSHGPRIKFYQTTSPDENSPSASISISNDPEVFEDSIGLNSKEKKELFKFIVLNKSRLLRIWYKGTFMPFEAFSKEIEKIRKIK